MMYHDPYEQIDSAWGYPWKPYGRCAVSTCLYHSVRCEFGFCKGCCDKIHGKIPNHIVPPAWQVSRIISNSGDVDARLPVHYVDKTSEPRLGKMEEVAEMERHTTFMYSDDPWYKI